MRLTTLMTNYLSTDALIMYGFLLITLIIGLWPGRKVKIIRDYAIANSAHGTGVLTIYLVSYFYYVLASSRLRRICV